MGSSVSRPNVYFPESYKSSFKGKVLIIGAGCSGMTAGYVLDDLGIEYEILEAASTHGGRIKETRKFADFPIDLGAEWVHAGLYKNCRPPFLFDILENKNTDPRIKTFSWKPKQMRLTNKKLKPVPSYVEAFLTAGGGDLKFRNSSWFEVFNERVFPKIKDNVRFNSVVREINYDEEKVRVETESGEVFEADKVLVTVPVKILQKELIKFSPPLPEKKLEAIKSEHVPSGFKVFIQFEEQFYPGGIVLGSYWNAIKNHSAYFDATLGKDTDQHVFGLFARGSDAEKYRPKKDENLELGTEAYNEKIVDNILAELDELFDGKATKTYIKSLVQDWDAETHIQGSYSNFLSILKGKHKSLISPLQEKVYFAGEAMNEKRNNIAVHGATESAYLSLKKMLKKYEIH